jgi:hypothetical protein
MLILPLPSTTFVSFFAPYPYPQGSEIAWDAKAIRLAGSRSNAAEVTGLQCLSNEHGARSLP